MLMNDVVRVPLGTFVRPGVLNDEGLPVSKVVNGYLVQHRETLILIDTGMGEVGDVDDETENFYQPTRRPLPDALDEVGVSLEDVTLLFNCHLHFDHCGGNKHFPETPILTQRTELDLAQGPDHTPTHLVDFPGAKYEVLDGEAEVLDGVIVLPTPGHTAGHQSIAVRCDDGTVLLAGQQHQDADDFIADVAATRSPTESSQPPSWMPRLLDLDPRRVVFAHDDTEWVP